MSEPRAKDLAGFLGRDLPPPGDEPRDPRPAPTPRIGRYELLEVLGRGGGGIVHRARDPLLGRQVALKTLADDQQGEAALRLQREALLTSRLSHPGIVQVYETGAGGGRHWIAMQLVEGPTLDRRWPELDLRGRIRLLEQVAEAVGAAHRAGVVHRDLKPTNVLVGPGDHPRVSDFGLARTVDQLTRLTASGVVMGTPLYIAPEQLLPDSTPAGPRADVWALGVMLYQMLVGSLPFRGANMEALLQAILETDPPPVGPDVPVELDRIARTCLAKNPAARYPSAADVAAELRAWLDGGSMRGGPRPERWRTLAALALPILIALVLAAWWTLRG